MWLTVIDVLAAVCYFGSAIAILFPVSHDNVTYVIWALHICAASWLYLIIRSFIGNIADWLKKHFDDGKTPR